MAEKNKTQKATPFERELIDTAKKVSEFKLNTEANVVAIIYKSPEVLYGDALSLDLFSDNIWKVYWQIAYDIILVEKKNTLDDMTVGFYLEKHPKLKTEYDKNGGYDTIQSAMEYVKIENYDGYVAELKKWKSILHLCGKGFPVKDRLSDFADMSAEEIYQEYEVFLNHTFANISEEVKSYNVFENIHEFIDELNSESEVGIPFYNAELLTKETGGFNINGNIYGLGAGSGCGKSTMAFNYIIPSAIESKQKVVFIINEEDERKFKKELIIWVANNIILKEEDEKLKKYILRDGGFDKEENKKKGIMDLLRKCANWIEEKKDQRIFTVIPLEKYSVNTVVKIIKKYSTAFDCRIFVLDTLKESYDATTDEIHKSMMRDMVTLYNTVKPTAKNVGLFVTYQLGKSSLKMRHYTNNEIGQAKSIIDVMSVNLMMRRPYEDEYEGEQKALKCWYYKDDDKMHNEFPYHLKKGTSYMITFITKNRFGVTDQYQIVSECDLSTNIYKDVAYCLVPQDW